jgi:hypothetical protein
MPEISFGIFSILFDSRFNRWIDSFMQMKRGISLILFDRADKSVNEINYPTQLGII